MPYINLAWLILASVFLYFGRFAIEQRLRRDNDKELEAYKGRLKTEADLALEKLKGDNEKELQSHKIEFEKLHDIRVTTIREIYSHVVELDTVASIHLGGYSQSPESMTGRFFEELLKVINLVDASECLFTEEDAAQLKLFGNKLAELEMERSRINTLSLETDEKYKQEVTLRNTQLKKKVYEEIPKLRKALEKIFRDILGVRSRGKES